MGLGLENTGEASLVAARVYQAASLGPGQRNILNKLHYDVLVKLVLPSSHGSDRCFSYIMSPYIHSLISAGLKGVASACCIVHRNMPTSGPWNNGKEVPK